MIHFWCVFSAQLFGARRPVELWSLKKWWCFSISWATLVITHGKEESGYLVTHPEIDAIWNWCYMMLYDAIGYMLSFIYDVAMFDYIVILPCSSTMTRTLSPLASHVATRQDRGRQRRRRGSNSWCVSGPLNRTDLTMVRNLDAETVHPRNVGGLQVTAIWRYFLTFYMLVNLVIE